MNKLEKVLIEEDKVAIASLEMAVNHGKELIDNSIVEWDKISPIGLTLDELHSFISPEPMRLPLPEKVDSLLREKLITGKKLSFEGIKLNAEKLKELLVMPDVTEFITSLSKFKDPIPSKTFSITECIYWKYYRIVNGKVIILTKDVEAHKDTMREYAITADEIERLKTTLPLCEALTAFMKANPTIHDIDFVSKNLMNYNEKERSFNPGAGFVKYNWI